MENHTSQSDVCHSLFQAVGLWGSASWAAWGGGAGAGLVEAQTGLPLSIVWGGRTPLMEGTPPAVPLPDFGFERNVNLGQDVKEALNWV